MYPSWSSEAANMAPFENQWSQEDLYTVNPFLIGDGWPMFRRKFALKFRDWIWVLARMDFQPGSFFPEKTTKGIDGEEIVILNTVSYKSASIPTSLGSYWIFAKTPLTFWVKKSTFWESLCFCLWRIESLNVQILNWLDYFHNNFPTDGKGTIPICQGNTFSTAFLLVAPKNGYILPRVCHRDQWLQCYWPPISGDTDGCLK